MKKIFLLCTFVFALASVSVAQLPNGSVAPDFTLTDINGNTHNLYTYLNQGKTVYIDIFAAWCGPCWSYHQSHALEDLWNLYGPGGTNEAVVIAVEASTSTNLACLYGPAGCNSSTQGNWTAGVTYPIVHSDNLNGTYNYGTYPTIYMVCPQGKTVWQAGQNSAAGHWAFRTNKCINGSIPLGVTLMNKQDVHCINTATGKVDILATGGFAPYTYVWSNGSTFQDIVNVPAGTYTVTVTAQNGATVVAGPYVVSNPASALTTQGVVVQQSGCNGVLGSVQANASGGWNFGYFYQWANGSTSQTLTNVPAGLYQCTVTDNNYCTKTVSVSMQQAAAPTATIATPGVITCATPTVQLNASGSSSGSNNLSYAWNALAGNIVSGANTATPIVNQQGAYEVVVTDNVSTCTASGFVQVNSNISAPVCSAPTVITLSCTQPTATLTAFASGGSQYQWQASNGGIILSGATALSCVVGSAGTYTFTVTNTGNGCSASATTQVNNSGNLPSVMATGGAITCSSSSVILNATSATPGVSYAWAGPGGFISTTQNPTVSVAGTYTVVVLDGNGCSNTTQAIVTSNITTPSVTASASSSVINCNNAQSTLTAMVSPSANYTYQWTLNGNNLGSSATINATAGGTYQVVATNPANGCSSTAQVSITAYGPMTVSAQATAQVLCFGANTGAASSTANGGAPNYSCAWSNGATTANINNLSPGTYSVICTDTQGCSSSASVTISGPSSQLTASATATAQTATGVNNGTASASASGGTSPYSYAWSNGGTTQTITGLAPGTFTVVISDANNCTQTASTSVQSVNCALVAVPSSTNATCFGLANGSASVIVDGAAMPVTFTWTPNVSTTSTATNLAAGPYTVVCTDAQGCSISRTITIGQPSQLVIASLTATNVQCAGQNTATVSMTGLTGGTTPFGVPSWSNGATGTTIGNVGAGTYTVTATDANGCSVTNTATVNIIDDTPPTIQCSSPIIVCSNNANVFYPTPTVSDNCTVNNNNLIRTGGPISGAAFPVGQTTVTYSYIDDGGNAVSCSFVVTVTPPIVLATSAVVNPVLGVSTGGVNVSITGGTAPYTYKWTNAAGATVSSDQNLSGIDASGVFTLLVTDANGCTMTFAPFTITATVSANEPSWMQGVMIQPNPVHQEVFITWSQTADMQISVLDINGRMVRDFTSHATNTLSIPVSDWAEGVYMIRLQTGNEVGYRKLIKQ